MFDEKMLRELASIQTTGPILSVYLDMDPIQQASEAYKLKLREMLKQVDQTADSADIDAVRHYVDYAYDWSGRGLILFSRQAEDIWYAFPLAVPVRSIVEVARKPFISPLIALSGLYGHYAVALVDRQGGRFFLFEMGELVIEETATGEMVRHTRKGRGSSVVGMRGGAGFSGRKEAEVVQRNIKDAANAFGEFCDKHHPGLVLLAGTDRTLAQFQDLITPKLGSMVVGTFSADMDATEAQIREQSLAIIQEIRDNRQKELVNTVLTSAAKGMNGVVGLDDTLTIANEGRVQVLIAARDYHAPGFRCVGCGYLTTQQQEKCLFCGGQFEEIHDAVEAVMAQVVEKGGTAEVIDDDHMGQMQIGALLRY